VHINVLILSDPRLHIQLWQSLLDLECPLDQHVIEEWRNIVKAQVQKRTNEVKFQ